MNQPASNYRNCLCGARHIRAAIIPSVDAKRCELSFWGGPRLKSSMCLAAGPKRANVQFPRLLRGRMTSRNRARIHQSSGALSNETTSSGSEVSLRQQIAPLVMLFLFQFFTPITLFSISLEFKTFSTQHFSDAFKIVQTLVRVRLGVVQNRFLIFYFLNVQLSFHFLSYSVHLS